MAREKKATAKKTAPKKAVAKKTASKKLTAPKKAPAKKAAPKKKAAPAKKAAPKKKAAPAKKAAPKKKAAARKTASKTVAASKKAPAKKKAAPKKAAPKKAAPKKAAIDHAELFQPLTEGERADSLRLLLEDKRLATMAKVGRYRVIAIEPLVLKPSNPRGSHRIARVLIYDYAADRCVEANVNLDLYQVQYLSINQSQPMLSIEEELAAMQIAVADTRVSSCLALGERPQAAMHYWSRKSAELAHNRRSAAVLFGEPGARASLVAIVDLLDALVTDIVPADHW